MSTPRHPPTRRSSQSEPSPDEHLPEAIAPVPEAAPKTASKRRASRKAIAPDTPNLASDSGVAAPSDSSKTAPLHPEALEMFEAIAPRDGISPDLSDLPTEHAIVQDVVREEHGRQLSTRLHRVGIFIDGSNLFYAALQLGIEVDYSKLLCRLTRGRRLFRAYFYTGRDRHNEKQQGFLLWMRRNGYRVVAKDLIQMPDGSRKANLDVEIAVDMVMLAQYCDTIVLLSGDGDLAYAVNTVTYRGTRVEVVGLQTMTSDSLMNVADHYTDLGDIRHEIQKGQSAALYPSYPEPFRIAVENPDSFQ